MSDTLKFVVMDFELDCEVELPSKIVVCPCCGGRGVKDNPAFANGISQEEFDEDPDFREQYMAGVYDVPCYECKGRNVVAEPDLERLTPRQKQLLDEFYQARREEAAERRMRERGIEF
jgi:hypothetical protein